MYLPRLVLCQHLSTNTTGLTDNGIFIQVCDGCFILRSKYLIGEERLVVLPEGGFFKTNHNVSNLCKTFLDYIEFCTGMCIAREVRIGRWTVDAVIEPLDCPLDHPLLNMLPLNTKIVVEIDGL